MKLGQIGSGQGLPVVPTRIARGTGQMSAVVVPSPSDQANMIYGMLKNNYSGSFGCFRDFSSHGVMPFVATLLVGERPVKTPKGYSDAMMRSAITLHRTLARLDDLPEDGLKRLLGIAEIVLDLAAEDLAADRQARLSSEAP